ncbi:MAG: serine/threonine protein kinase, partial [Planctomycetaceae bacterium]|nr:serine/threonine protein kinase [Planctomycetaceae bacterium]
MLEQLGPYLIDEQIGRGGMGFVYSARHEETDEQVAVKTLLNAFADDDTFRDRFHQEIETLQQLQHVGIVRIIGYGQEDGVLFYAMELVKGRTLFQILKETGTISWREVIRITIDVCHALKHAHDRGVIHRDLK